MKIPVRVQNKGRLMPNVLLTIRGSRNIIPFEAVIDTGSSDTILSYKDATSLQIPIVSMPVVKKIQGISSNKAGLCEYKKGLVLSLKKENGEFFSVKKETVYISKEKEGANISILGMDFLAENNLQLFYDPHGEAYLQTKD